MNLCYVCDMSGVENILFWPRVLVREWVPTCFDPKLGSEEGLEHKYIVLGSKPGLPKKWCIWKRGFQIGSSLLTNEEKTEFPCTPTTDQSPPSGPRFRYTTGAEYPPLRHVPSPIRRGTHWGTLKNEDTKGHVHKQRHRKRVQKFVLPGRTKPLKWTG